MELFHKKLAITTAHLSGQIFAPYSPFLSGKIGHLQDPVTWYGINYTGTQMTQRDFQNKGTLTSPARLSFVLKVPLRHLRPSVIYSVPCDWILQMVYSQADFKPHGKLETVRVRGFQK